MDPVIVSDSLHDGEKLSKAEYETAPTVPLGPGAPPVLTSAFTGQSGPRIVLKFWRLFAIAVGVSLGGMYAGYCISAAGNIVANQGFIAQFGTIRDAAGELELDAQYVSFWGGFYYVAQVVFQALSPLVADSFGRKAAMLVLTVFMLIAIIIECVARDWKDYLAAKIFSGVSTAFLGTAIMTYLSEIAIAPIRGAMLATFSFSFALGQFFNSVGLQILNSTNPLAFRRAFYSEFVIFAIWLPFALFVPESPSWLCLKGRHEEAERALRRLIGNVSGWDHSHEYAVIRQGVEDSVRQAAAHGNSDWRVVFRWVNFKRCLAATLPLSAQNFVGVPLVFGFTTYFFQLAGLSNAFTGSVIVYVILLVGIGFSFHFVDLFGRRPIVLGSTFIMGLVDIAIGGLGCAKPSSAVGSGLVALCSIWVFVYSLSLAPVGWISLVELSSPKLRAKTAAIGTIIQSFSGILFSYTVPLMLSAQYAGWSTKIGFFFGGTSFLILLPTYFLLPESKGRTYAELDELYERGVSPRKFKTTITATEEARTPDVPTTV